MKALCYLHTSLIALLLLAGCATQPVAEKESDSISSSHLISARTVGAVTSMEEGGKIVITRHDEPLIASRQIKVFIHLRGPNLPSPVAEFILRPNERYEALLRGGEYVLNARETSRNPFISGFRNAAWGPPPASITCGRTLYYRVGFQDGKVVIRKTRPPQ